VLNDPRPCRDLLAAIIANEQKQMVRNQARMIDTTREGYRLMSRAVSLLTKPRPDRLSDERACYEVLYQIRAFVRGRQPEPLLDAYTAQLWEELRDYLGRIPHSGLLLED